MDSRISHLRILACFMVILLHVAATDFHQFDERWWPANLWDSVTRICVPLFFMISGAGLLCKDEALNVFFKKRFLKILPPLVFWSIFYALWRWVNGQQSDNFLLSILSGPKPYPLWYLYALVGLYLFTPILRKFYQHSTKTEKLWLIGTWFVSSSLLPTLINTLPLSTCTMLDAAPLNAVYNTYNLFYFTGYAGYFFVGAYLYEMKAPSSKSWLGFGAFSAATALLTYMASVKSGQPCSTFYSYSSPNVVAASVCFFAAFMTLPRSAPSRVIQVVSGCTLGIYCLHMVFLESLLPGVASRIPSTLRWVSAPLEAGLIFAICFVIVHSLRRIKIFRTVC